VASVKTGIDEEQALHAAQKQPGTDKQHEGKRYLRYHERAAGDTLTACGAARGLLKPGMKIGPRQMQRRDHAREQTNRRGDGDRKYESRRVEGDGVEAREARRTQRDERAYASIRNTHAAEATEQRE
jgi:hypothetical protein